MNIEHKNFVIMGDGTFGMKVIKHSGSGTLPSALKGSFTNSNSAIKAIDLYIRSKEKKSNAKANSTS